MSKEVEGIIKKRLSSQVSKDFDKKFWSKFDSQNPKPKKSWFNFSLLAPMAAAIVLIFFVTNQSQISGPAKTAEQINNEESKILADLDQQDWEILLGDDFDS